MRIAVPLSSTIFIFLIFELHTNLADPTNAIRNIRKVLTLFQNYQRGYHYFSKNNFWNRNKDPTGINDAMYQEFCYIHYQAKYGRNFTDLHSIFISQILALIYAWKFKQRETRLRTSFPNVKAFQESLIYEFFADYGTQSESVAPVIRRIMEVKYPKSHEDFWGISFAFDGFREKIRQLAMEKSTDLEIMNSNFKKELREKASILITYIKNTLLQIPQDFVTGFGIDIMSELNLPLNTGSIIELSQRNPNMIFTNYDTGREDMVKSVVVDVLESLIFNIASFISERTGAEARQDIKSFILLHSWKEKPNILIIVEVPFDFLGSYFPKPDPVHWSTRVSNWVYDSLPLKF